MFDRRALDRALLSGAYRTGRVNIRPVRCGACDVDCLPGQARRIILTAAWPVQQTFLCLQSCLPRERGIADATGVP